MLTDDELRRIRDHAAANPSHAGDVTLRLVAEVERLRKEVAALHVPGPYPELHMEPPNFEWTEHDYKVRQAVREFNEGLEGGPP